MNCELSMRRIFDVKEVIVKVVEEVIDKMRQEDIAAPTANGICSIALAAVLYNLLDFSLEEVDHPQLLAEAKRLSLRHFFPAAGVVAACGCPIGETLFLTVEVARVTCPACVTALSPGSKQ